MSLIELNNSIYNSDDANIQDGRINLEEDFYDSSVETQPAIAAAKITLPDLTVLMFMWLLVFATSLKTFGKFPGFLFLLLNIIMVFRRPINGFLILLLIGFSPSVSLLVPRIFVVSFVIAIFGYIVRGTFLTHLTSVFAKPVLVTAGFVLFTGLTLLITPDKEVGMRYYVDYLEGLMFVMMLFALINSKDELGIVLKWFVIVAALTLFINVAHYIEGFGTALYNITVAGKGMEMVENKATIIIGGRIANRLVWFGAEPNYFAAQLIFPLAAGVGLYSASDKIWKKVFWLMASILIGIGILGTYSRGGFLSASGFFGLFILRKNVKAIIPGTVLLCAAILLLTAVPEISGRIFSIGHSVKVEGATGRFDIFRMALNMWFSSPLWGRGIGAFVVTTKHVAHNAFLQVLAEEGLIGGFLYVMIIFIAFKSCYNIKHFYNNKNEPDLVLSQILMLGLIGTCLSISTITPNDPNFVWLACGICSIFYIVVRKSAFEQYQFYGHHEDNQSVGLSNVGSVGQL